MGRGGVARASPRPASWRGVNAHLASSQDFFRYLVERWIARASTAHLRVGSYYLNAEKAAKRIAVDTMRRRRKGRGRPTRGQSAIGRVARSRQVGPIKWKAIPPLLIGLATRSGPNLEESGITRA